jgi:hypothetical protein
MSTLELILSEIDVEGLFQQFNSLVDARCSQLLQQQQIMIALMDANLQIQLSKIPSSIKTMKMNEYKEKYNEDLETYLKNHKTRPTPKTNLYSTVKSTTHEDKSKPLPEIQDFLSQ